MEQCVYYFRETLVGSNELSLSFWFVSNIYKLNRINFVTKKKKKRKTSHFSIPLSTTTEASGRDHRFSSRSARLLRWSCTRRQLSLISPMGRGKLWLTPVNLFSSLRSPGEFLKHQCHGTQFLS